MRFFILFCYLLLLTRCFKTCDQQIDDPYRKLSSYEVSTLCNKLKTFNQDIYFRLIDDAPHQGSSLDKYYEDDSNNYFNMKCKGRCSISIAVIVYFNAKKLRMVVGSEIDKVMNIYSQQSILDSMKSYLKDNRFSSAFQLALDKISEKVPKSKVYPPGDEKSSSGSSSVWLFLTLIIVGCCVCCICGFICCCQKQEEVVVRNSNTTDETIHLHMEKLLDIVKFKIKTSIPPMTQIEQCVICMNYLNANWERDELNGVSNSNIFLSKFTCGHLYHSTCLSNKGINGCIMCQLNEAQVNVMPEVRYFNIVSEDNIFNVIKRFDMIYPQRLLQTYNKNYSNDMVVVKEVYPSYTPSTFVWVDIGPHYYGGYGGGYSGGYYEHNTYNTYNNNYSNNYDNSYNPPNAVPQNNYNVVTGVDYGGSDSGGQNYTYGGDDYGGSNNVGDDY